MNIAPVAGEVRHPQRNLPLAFLGGVGIVTFLYLGANLAYYMVLPGWEMTLMKNTPVATGYSLRLLGSVGGVVTSAAIMCSVFGALNGNLLVGPRLLYAMGEDHLAPKSLSAVHVRYHTPAPAIWVMGGWACTLVLSVAILTALEVLSRSKSHFDVLTDFCMFGAVLFETLAVTTIFVFRRKLPHVGRPYRCWGYPLVPLVYLILPALVLGNMFVNQRLEALTGMGFIALGAAVYCVFLRRSGASSDGLRGNEVVILRPAPPADGRT
jgi:amino acid transporter